MGAIVGGLIGGIGSLIAGNARQHAARAAARQAQQSALTGYNYLTKGAGAPATAQYVQNGMAANNAQAQLLGQAPITDQTSNGFNNYLNSTAYRFQLGQGTNAIASNAASRGLLNSGGTAKALEAYGQGLAGQTFNNYLNQLGGLSGAGQRQLGMVSGSGNSGAYAANAIGRSTQAAGAAKASGIMTGLGAFTNALSGI